jgi:hypothetical protein
MQLEIRINSQDFCQTFFLEAIQKLSTNWMGLTFRAEPIGARMAPRCCAAKRGPSTRFEQTRPRPSKLVRVPAAHPRLVNFEE